MDESEKSPGESKSATVLPPEHIRLAAIRWRLGELIRGDEEPP